MKTPVCMIFRKGRYSASFRSSICTNRELQSLALQRPIPKIRNKYSQKRNCWPPQSQFPHSCVCERFIYSQDRSAYSAAGNMWTEPRNIQIAHKHMNVEIGTEATQFQGVHQWDFVAVRKIKPIYNNILTKRLTTVYLSFETRNEVQYAQPTIYKKCIGSLN
jgi:hypothetical protein